MAFSPLAGGRRQLRTGVAHFEHLSPGEIQSWEALADGFFTTSATWEALLASNKFSSVQSLSRVRLLATPWIAEIGRAHV